MVAQEFECTKRHWPVHLKRAKMIIYILPQFFFFWFQGLLVFFFGFVVVLLYIRSSLMIHLKHSSACRSVPNSQILPPHPPPQPPFFKVKKI